MMDNLLTTKDIEDCYVEIGLRAKNNYGNWDNKEEAREKIYQAIEDITEEERENINHQLCNAPEFRELIKEMLE